MACSSSCRTQDHASYGECLRSKNLKTAYMQEWKGLDYTREKKHDKNLDKYQELRRYGIQPKTTYKHDVDMAERISDKTGKAFKA